MAQCGRFTNFIRFYFDRINQGLKELSHWDSGLGINLDSWQGILSSFVNIPWQVFLCYGCHNTPVTRGRLGLVRHMSWSQLVTLAMWGPGPDWLLIVMVRTPCVIIKYRVLFTSQPGHRGFKTSCRKNFFTLSYISSIQMFGSPIDKTLLSIRNVVQENNQSVTAASCLCSLMSRGPGMGEWVSSSDHLVTSSLQ